MTKRAALFLAAVATHVLGVTLYPRPGSDALAAETRPGSRFDDHGEHPASIGAANQEAALAAGVGGVVGRNVSVRY